MLLVANFMLKCRYKFLWIRVPFSRFPALHSWFVSRRRSRSCC